MCIGTRRALAALAAVVLAGWGLGRGVRRVAEGEVLIDRNGTEAGPTWVVRAPWRRSPVFPVSERVEIDARASLPEGASWTVWTSIDLRVEPASRTVSLTVGDSPPSL